MSRSSENDSPSVDQTEKSQATLADQVLTADPGNEADFKVGKKELLIILTMAALNVILALDATVLPPALPVSTLPFSLRVLHFK
jgi:hypothetical protein